MYRVAIKRDFVAQHFLIGGDWGAENEWHSHHYQAEVQLEGASLDQHGYLVDIVDIEANLDAVVAYFQDQTLNDKPEFEGLNTGIERFAHIFCDALAKRIQAPNLTSMTVKLWEHENAWASYRQEL